jgi:hypothetical protein
MKRDTLRRSQLTAARRRRLSAVAAAGVTSLGAMAHADTTTTLTGLPNTNADVPANHGSNGEVTLTWDTAWDQYTGWDGRGDVYQVDERVVTLEFVPTAANIGGPTQALWTVVGSASGTIASGNWTDFLVADGGRSLVSPNAVGQAGESLALVIDHSASGGFISYLAMDNLTFSTRVGVVPEPATTALAMSGVAGLGALAMRRRRS